MILHLLSKFGASWTWCYTSVALKVSPRVRGRERWWGLTGWTGRNSSIVSLLIRRHRNVHLPSNYCFKAGGQKTAPHHVRWNEFTRCLSQTLFQHIWKHTVPLIITVRFQIQVHKNNRSLSPCCFRAEAHWSNHKLTHLLTYCLTLWTLIWKWL